jgi:hypothetical protein
MFSFKDRLFATKFEKPAVAVLAVAVTILAAFFLGALSFHGLEFLAYWQRTLRGWFLGFSISSALFFSWFQFIAWDRAANGTALWLAGIFSVFLSAVLVAVLSVWWFARQYDQCDLIAMPFATLFSGLLIFGAGACEFAILRRFAIIRGIREAGRKRAAFAILLFLEAILMFMIGELFTVGRYANGLEHFQKAHTAVSTIAASDNINFLPATGVVR